MIRSIYKKILLLIAFSFITLSYSTYNILMPYIEKTVIAKELYNYKTGLIITLIAFHLLLIAIVLIIRSLTNKNPLVSTEFLANISHEIRTPMNAIIGSANLLIKEPLTPVQQKYIKSIAQSGQNILTITNEILNYSKIKNKKQEINYEAFDLYEEINNTYTIFKSLAEEKGLTLEFSCDKLPIGVIGDPGAILQIISNFINNAIKFTPKGSIKLSVNIEEATTSEISLIFNVVDTGIGISEKDQDKVFQTYEQFNSAAIIKARGTGLGLFISKHLAEAMGGSIGFNSKENNGSTFWLKIKLPIASIEECSEILFKDSAVEYPMFNAKVLLAEDSMTNNYIITAMLEKIGCTVDSVFNGEEALQKVANNKYDLIFMDRIMPIVNGLEAANHIRETEEVENTIIALTAGVFLDEKESCLKAGMNIVLPKPVIIDDFVNIFNKYIPELKVKDAVYTREGDYISWSDKLSLGIKSIDDQHKNICKYINALHKAINEKENGNTIDQILMNLIDYTDIHFSYEEKYFKKFNYKHKEDHCESHRKLKEKLQGFIYKHENKENISKELFKFLKNWLTNHILLEDALYVNCFKNNGLE